MPLPRSSWKNVLTSLGFSAGPSRAGASRNRSLRFETLEARNLMTAAPAFQVSPGQSSIDESESVSFAVYRSGDDLPAQEAAYTVSGGAAPTSSSLSFAAGQTSAGITVAAMDDAIADGDDTITLSIGGASASVTVRENDYSGCGCGSGCGSGSGSGLSSPSYSISVPGSLVEGDTGVFTISRSGDSLPAENAGVLFFDGLVRLLLGLRLVRRRSELGQRQFQPY